MEKKKDITKLADSIATDIDSLIGDREEKFRGQEIESLSGKLAGKANEGSKTQDAEKEEKQPVVTEILKSDYKKGKMISVKINEKTYAQFTQINRMLGESNNGVINRLISSYVISNRNILNE